MKFKNHLPLLILLLSLSVSAQNKVLTYSSIQSRNDLHQWEPKVEIPKQQISFSGGKINVKIDKDYELTIITKTRLPDNGMIYICQDEKYDPVSIMVVDDGKMYFYYKSKRFLINFDTVKAKS